MLAMGLIFFRADYQIAWSASGGDKEDNAKGDEGHDDGGGVGSICGERSLLVRRRQGVIYADSSPTRRALAHRLFRRGTTRAVAAAAAAFAWTDVVVGWQRRRRDCGDDGGQLQVPQARHIQVLHVAGVRGATLDARHLRPAQVHHRRGTIAAGAPRVEDELVRRET